MAEIILGVTGSIAAYKAADLCSKLTQAGHRVSVVMTENATNLVGTSTFLNLSGRKVFTDLWRDAQGQIEHIALTDRAELVLVAPATANTIAHMALGLAPNALATLLLAVACPVMVCPAMNPRMWNHPAVQGNVTTLRARGVVVMTPAQGSMACGHTGPGRLPEALEIVQAAEQLLEHGALGEQKRFHATLHPATQIPEPSLLERQAIAERRLYTQGRLAVIGAFAPDWHAGGFAVLIAVNLAAAQRSLEAMPLIQSGLVEASLQALA